MDINKRIIFIAVVMICLVGTIGYLYFNDSSSTTSAGFNFGSLTVGEERPTLEQLYETSGDFIIEDDSVYIDDANLYLSATPHTLYKSGEVTFNLISKTYGGSADIIFGFDYPTTKPTSAEYYNPAQTVSEDSFTCDSPYTFNYTTNPKVFYCWKNTGANETSDGKTLVFSHSYDRADLPAKTAYWNVYTNEDWHDISGSFQSVDYEYEGMNKWYYKTFNVVQGQEYTMRADIEVPFGDVGARKYWVCIKPSAESISTAVSNGHLYCLDPWYEPTLFTYRYPIYHNASELNGTYSVNDTNGVGLNGNIIWAYLWNDSYVYSSGVGTTGNITIANETHEKCFENETTSAGSVGNCVDDIYPSAHVVYHFGEGAGTQTNSSITVGNGFNGTFKGAGEPQWTTSGLFGNAIDCDGTDDYVQLNAGVGGASLAGNGTIEFWFRPDGGFTDAAVTNEMLFSKKSSAGNGIRVQLSESNGLLYTELGTSTTAVWQDSWYHVAVVWGDDGKRIYVNGTLETTNAAGGKWSSAADAYIPSLCIYWDNLDNSKTQPFDGKMDEFRIWNRSLSTEEVENIYYTGLDMRTTTGTFEINDDAITGSNESYSTHIYEAYQTTYNVNISLNQSELVGVTGQLVWNNTIYSATGWNTTPTLWHFNRTIVPGLIVTNGTSVNFFWNFTGTYDTGTWNDTLGSDSQTIVYGTYWSGGVISDSTPLASDTIQINSTLTTPTNMSSYSQRLYVNGESFTLSNDGTTYYRDYTTEMVSIANTSAYYFETYVSYLGRVLNRTSVPATFTITPISITECGTGALILTYYYHDEEQPNKFVNVSKEVTFKVWKSDPNTYATFSFTKTANQSHNFCIYPGYASAYIFSDELYGNITGDADGQIYPERKYHIVCDEFSNATNQTINQYLINGSVSQVTSVKVVDGADNPIEGAVVKSRRYYIGEDVYRTADMTQTDANGDGTLRLIPSTQDIDAFYDFYVYQGCSLSKSFSKMNIVGTSITFPIVGVQSPTYWNVWNDTSWVCSFNNATSLLTCEFEDYGSTASTFELYVQQVDTDGYTEICNETSSADADTLLCDLSGMTTETYNYWFMVSYSGSQFLIDAGTIHNIAEGVFATSGLFIAAIMLIGISLIGFNDPKLMIVLSLIATVFNQLIGFTTGTWAGIAALVIAAGLILYKG